MLEKENDTEVQALEKVQYWKNQYSELERSLLQKIDDLKAEYETKLKEAQDTKTSNTSITTPSPPSSINQLIQEVKSNVGNAMSGLKQAENDILNISLKVSNNEERIEEGDQYGRVSSLLAHKLEGIPVKQFGKEFYDFVLKFLNEKFPSKECDVERHHIDIAHTIKSRKKDSKPVLLIKFCNRWVRDMIFFCKKDLKGTGISITEHLTPYTRQLLDAAKQCYGVGNVWTRNCIVTALVNGNKTPIRSFSELNRFSKSNYSYNNPAFVDVNFTAVPPAAIETPSVISPALHDVYSQRQQTCPPPGFHQLGAGYGYHSYNPGWRR